jgi:C_GCAxxG_C_C family probable redox protein
MTDPIPVANGRFARGYNCAQSVFSAFAEQRGVSGDLALRLSASFGGGLGRAGEVCGALSGALMVLGLEFGNDRPESKEDVYRRVREFMGEFQRHNGSVRCSDILGHDISTPEGLQAARNNNVFSAVCPRVVDETARALAAYLAEHKSS